jgi:hypothetical protein
MNPETARYRANLHVARLALRELLEDRALPAEIWDAVDTLHRRLGREMNHAAREPGD